MVQTTGRKFVELIQLYEDFPLFWRDLEASERTGVPVDLSAAARAAQASAKAEDQLIFFGNKALGVDGLLTVPGSNTIKMDDWAEGQNAFANIAAGASMLVEKDMLGRLALVMGPASYTHLADCTYRRSTEYYPGSGFYFCVWHGRPGRRTGNHSFTGCFGHLGLSVFDGQKNHHQN